MLLVQALVYHFESIWEIVRKVPVREKRINLGEVRDVAYVITYSILILVPVIEMKSEISKNIDSLQNRNGIISTTAEIEYLAKARLKKKLRKS